MQLYDWQLPAAEKQFDILKRYGKAINVSSTGVGKTFIAADTASRLGLPVFVICPKSIISMWSRTLGEVGVTSHVVLNWEKIKTCRHCSFWNGERWAFEQPYFIIVDEVHAGTTGPQSQTTFMAAKLKAYTTLPKLYMSATIADSPLQLRALGYLFDLHDFSEPNFYRWCLDMGCERAKVPNGRGGYVWTIRMPHAKYRAKEVMLRLRDLLAPYTIRLTPDDAPGFPETTIVAELFDLETRVTAEIRKLYEPLAKAHRTLSADERAQLVIARQRTEILKVPLLEELTRNLLAENRSVVVFLNFHEPMDLLAKALGADNVVQIRGGQSDAERQFAIEEFQANRRHVCLAQTQAGGVAVSLHDIHGDRPRTSLLCPDWNAKRTVQCLGRIRRAGGTKSVQIFVLAAKTLEERVYESLNRKRGNIDTLNDGDMEGIKQ